MNEAFWRGRRVLVTGHTGFKGGWLALWLAHWGAKVTGFALEPPSDPNFFTAAQVDRVAVSVQGDVRDPAALSRVIGAAQPEVVFHLAAQALVRPSYQDPAATFATNLMGTVNLLQAVRGCPATRAVVVVTSDKCYENREWAWGYRETDPMGGHDPYSASKGCAELATASFRRSFFSGPRRHPAAIASARAGNVIGGGDWGRDRLVPDFIRAVTRREPLVVRRPGALRPWQHVLEPVGGYLLLAEKLASGQETWADGWNFGPAAADSKPVAWLAKRLTALWGPEAAFRVEEAGGPHEAHHLTLDCSRARELLGWRPRWGLEESLARLVAWHRAHLEGRPMQSLSLEQIREYLATPTATESP